MGDTKVTAENGSERASELARDLEKRGFLSSETFRAEVEPILAAALAVCAREARESLAWALTKVEFPIVSEGNGNWWKGCPGCRVVWKRDMEHGADCPYLRALERAVGEKASLDPQGGQHES